MEQSYLAQALARATTGDESGADAALKSAHFFGRLAKVGPQRGYLKISSAGEALGTCTAEAFERGVSDEALRRAVRALRRGETHRAVREGGQVVEITRLRGVVA